MMPHLKQIFIGLLIYVGIKFLCNLLGVILILQINFKLLGIGYI